MKLYEIICIVIVGFTELRGGFGPSGLKDVSGLDWECSDRTLRTGDFGFRLGNARFKFRVWGRVGV